MQVRIVTIAFSSRLGGFNDEPLRSFIADKQVHEMESWHFIHEGTPYWSICIRYTLNEGGNVGTPIRPGDKPKQENWRKRLSEKDWPVFNVLREWRKARAITEGVPSYLVFTNEQLTQIVTESVSSLAALGRVPGVGPSRVEKYGKDVLHILNERTTGVEREDTRAARVDDVDGVPGVAIANDREISEETASDIDEPDRQPGA